VAASSDPGPEPWEAGGLAGCGDALAEEDLALDDGAFDWSDPGTDMPAELLALSDQELQELYAAAQVRPVPARPVPPVWPLSWRTAYLPRRARGTRRARRATAARRNGRAAPGRGGSQRRGDCRAAGGGGRVCRGRARGR
jgi:hypothetical protein